MLTKTNLGLACVAAAMSVSLPAFGGARGMMSHPATFLRPAVQHPASGFWRSAANNRIGGRPAQTLPPFAGIIHERAGRGPTFTSFGHTNTAIVAGAHGYVLRGYGPAVAGQWAGTRRLAYAGQSGLRDRFGRLRRAYPGYGYGAGYAYGGYGGGYDDAAAGTVAGGGMVLPTVLTAPDTGGYVAPTPSYSYAEPPLAGMRAEPPLAAPSYDGIAAQPLRSGPHVVVLNNRTTSYASGHCPCRSAADGPLVVYRYGVGTAY